MATIKNTKKTTKNAKLAKAPVIKAKAVKTIAKAKKTHVPFAHGDNAKCVKINAGKAGTKIHAKLSGIKPGMTVRGICEKTGLSRFDLGCAERVGKVAFK